MEMTRKMTPIPTPAAARVRALPPIVRSDASPWLVTSAARAASYLRTDVRSNANHNSIRTTGVAVPAQAGMGFGAAKQGAPPRGVPR